MLVPVFPTRPCLVFQDFKIIHTKKVFQHLRLNGGNTSGTLKCLMHFKHCISNMLTVGKVSPASTAF